MLLSKSKFWSSLNSGETQARQGPVAHQAGLINPDQLARIIISLPASAEGPTLDAELNGEDMVFPLGPNLSLSWAHCTQRKSTEQSVLYQCELRSGYRFQ